MFGSSKNFSISTRASLCMHYLPVVWVWSAISTSGRIGIRLIHEYLHHSETASFINAMLHNFAISKISNTFQQLCQLSCALENCDALTLDLKSWRCTLRI